MVPIQRAGATVEFEMFLPWKDKGENAIRFTASEIASHFFTGNSQWSSFGTIAGKNGKTNFKGVIHPENLINFLQSLKNFEKTHKNSIDFSMETVWN